MSNNLPIAVIGAGLGGLPAAALLQAGGHDVRVYEQAPGFSRLGAGINLGPNVMKVLRAIGVEDRLIRIGIEPSSWANREWNTGRMQFECPLREDCVRKYGATYLLVHRGDFHALLTEAVAPGTIRFGKRLVDLEDEGDSVKLRFADGSTEDVRFVIGADGINSVVREVLLGPEEPVYTGFVAHRAIFPRELVKAPIPHDLTKWWSDDNHEADDDRHILVYYLTRARDEVYIVSGVPDPNWDSGVSFVEADLDEMIAVFDGFHQDLMEVLYACPAATKWPLLERNPLPLWSSGRIVLLGDACHPMKPHLGQGAAMAAEDATILVRCLEACGLDDPEPAFQLYEVSRRARTSDVQRHSHLNKWMRYEMNPDWVFGYDPITQELGVEAGTAGY